MPAKIVESVAWPLVSITRTLTMFACGATPVHMPCEAVPSPAIRPATCVPWPPGSPVECSPVKSTRATILPARSG